jgi:hypothetical protein
MASRRLTDEELDERNSFIGLDCATKDEWWAHIFLAGYVWPRLTVKGKVEKRKVQLQFLQGGNREAKGREALIRVLQSNLPSFLAHDLAVLFDEKVRTKAVQEFTQMNSGTYYRVDETRRLKFEHRSKKARNPFQDWDIRMFMHPSNGEKRSFKQAMGFFGLSRSAINDALKRTNEALARARK